MFLTQFEIVTYEGLRATNIKVLGSNLRISGNRYVFGYAPFLVQHLSLGITCLHAFSEYSSNSTSVF